MSQFQQGLRFRNANSIGPSTDFMVVTVDVLGYNYTSLTVMYLAPNTGKPLQRQKIIIAQEDYDAWKQIMEET